MPLIHLETLEAFKARATGQVGFEGCLLQGLDLRSENEELLNANVQGAVFLGCKLHQGVVLHLVAGGATVFPDLGKARPYHPTRSKLYTLNELMKGFEAHVVDSFEQSADIAIYNHFQGFRRDKHPPILETLAQRLHDHAIDDALSGVLAENGGRRVVGVMGGHALKRNDVLFREVARIGWSLAQKGYFVATGGGPGAMEAANLGAWMSCYDEHDLLAAVDILAAEPDYRKHEYLLLGYEVLDRYPNGAESLAVPTWFYGHEPSNQFSSHIAKYFSNSLREDGLLAIATHGVVYAPGSAGTIQEVFMDAAQNHYGTFHHVSPMVFLGDDEWTVQRPVLPLLRALAADRQYSHMIGNASSAEGVVRFIQEHPPVEYKQA